MLTKNDITTIRGIVKEEITIAVTPLVNKDHLAKAIAPLASKKELEDAIAPLASKDDLVKAIAPLASREEVKKGFAKLEKAIKKEHKIGGEILGYLEIEDRKIRQRVERVERHLGLIPMAD